jgi:hypothetical protein
MSARGSGDSMTVMSSDSVMVIPNRLREVFQRWDADGRPSQAGIVWSRRTWQSTLPEQQEIFAGLPDRLDRTTVTGYGARAAETEEEAVRSFVAAMVWGYGRTGYGASRTALR